MMNPVSNNGYFSSKDSHLTVVCVEEKQRIGMFTRSHARAGSTRRLYSAPVCSGRPRPSYQEVSVAVVEEPARLPAAAAHLLSICSSELPPGNGLAGCAPRRQVRRGGARKPEGGRGWGGVAGRGLSKCRKRRRWGEPIGSTRAALGDGGADGTGEDRYS
jgi:hypothetical protein